MPRSLSPLHILLAIAVMAVWGTNFVVIKLVLAHLPPLLLAALHAYVFLEGSEAAVLNPTVAEEAMHYLVTYMQRLTGAELRRVREDMATLVGFARSKKWPKQHVRFLQEFLEENGIGS